MISFISLFKDFNLLFFRDKSSRVFVLATICGLAFSISIVLSTLGLMDGFSKQLKQSLNEGHGEIVLMGQQGFFSNSYDNFKELKSFGISDIALMIKTQSFLTFKDTGRAVFVLGVDKTFEKINSAFKPPATGEVILGKTLASDLQIKVGDDISLTFASGRSGEKTLPSIGTFKVSKIHKFNIHHFDQRYIYANLSRIQSQIQVGDKVNLAKLKLDKELTDISSIEKIVEKLRSVFYLEYRVLPYWSDFATFLRAVDYEKYLISLVLYIVVIVAAFNCLAFIVYSKEKKAQEIFLLYAIGLSPRKFRKLWFIQNSIIWLLSFLLCLIFSKMTAYAIGNWGMFKLPSDVYSLSRIQLNLSLQNILLTAVSSFILISFLTFLTLKKLDSRSLAQGLREEFS